MPRLLVLLTLCLVVGTHWRRSPPQLPRRAATTAAQPSVASAKVSGRRSQAVEGADRVRSSTTRAAGRAGSASSGRSSTRSSTRPGARRSGSRSTRSTGCRSPRRSSPRTGVACKVQMILNDHQYTKAMRAIRKEIGAKRYRSSFIYRCTAGCRSKQNQYNNMHTKFYSFSQAGRSKDVLAVGSANMMLNADIHQWNDLYFTSGRPRAVPPVRPAVQRHAQGPRHPPATAVLLRHARQRRRVRRLGRQAHGLGLAQAVGPEERPRPRPARQGPVPDPRRCGRAEAEPHRGVDAHHARASAATTWPQRSGRSGSRGARCA